MSMIVVTDSTFDQMVFGSDKPVLVYFRRGEIRHDISETLYRIKKVFKNRLAIVTLDLETNEKIRTRFGFPHRVGISGRLSEIKLIFGGMTRLTLPLPDYSNPRYPHDLKIQMDLIENALSGQFIIRHS